VKNRFQSLPFKCNLQRYNKGAGMNDLLHTRMQFADQSLLENSSNKAMAGSCDLGGGCTR
jgi:hypothetical protein